MGRFNRNALRALSVVVALLGAGHVVACQSISGLADYKEGPALDAGVVDSAIVDSGLVREDAAPPEGSNPAQWAQFRLACGSDENCGLAEPIAPTSGDFYDPLTKITWLTSAAKSAASFQEAIAACGANRLPTRIELVSLLHRLPDADEWNFPTSLEASFNVFWSASVAYPIDPKKPLFWSVNRVTAEVRPGLPVPGSSLPKWSVLCILKP